MDSRLVSTRSRACSLRRLGKLLRRFPGRASKCRAITVGLVAGGWSSRDRAATGSSNVDTNESEHVVPAVEWAIGPSNGRMNATWEDCHEVPSHGARATKRRAQWIIWSCG